MIGDKLRTVDSNQCTWSNVVRDQMRVGFKLWVIQSAPVTYNF